MDEVVEDISHQFITMEGLMEKLPMNKKKATLLKTWKRRFFRARDGWLYYYESGNREDPSETIQLMGGQIHDMGSRVLGIDDGRGRYLMVRCPTEKEYGQWKIALESQTADNTRATFVRPVLKSTKNSSKNVIVIDLGSSAIRAGILGNQASLPEIFFPSVLAVDKETGKVVAIGPEALRPDVRNHCKIVHPIRPSNKVDQFNIELQYMGLIFKKVVEDLKINSSDYWVMLSTPQNLGDALKRGLMEKLVDQLNSRGVCMVQQALLSLYSYKATSGIIVDIGHRIEILPIFDGFVIEGGVSRCPFGAQKVLESLTTSLLGNNYKFMSSTEQWLVRYIMEQSCYVAMDYKQEEEWCRSRPETIRSTVEFKSFSLPDGSYMSVEHDLSRFKSPEGFFNADLWEMDYPTLQKLIHQAIQTCPMDNRRHMWRAVYLSGGLTMLPGFAERLEKELTKLAPPGVPVEVHAAPQRYHAAYVGACSVALMPQFEDMAISREEWKKNGVRAFKKWQAPAS
ncbi:actin-like [Physella acuta]|uniref:actin-like n=1 Tax=Physella acuta TaxID=109671 RepID=UPI0027DCC304|nr:actin-like [Physella acuta]